MYATAGSTNGRAHHLAAEILDNAMDEAAAGFATRIDLERNRKTFGSFATMGGEFPSIPIRSSRTSPLWKSS